MAEQGITDDGNDDWWKKKPATDGGFADILANVAEMERKKWANMTPIKKDYYEEHPEVTAMFDDEADQLRREKNDITVTDNSKDKEGKKRKPPKPIWKFEHAFHNYPELLKQLTDLYEGPSPIQCQLWPVAMSGYDAIGIAQTGSGKTLGFLLPVFVHIDGKPADEKLGPSCLVLTPTRELALQIEREVRKYHYRGIKSVCIYGGGDRKQQCDDCTEGVDVVIATPGRLNDLVCSDVVNLRSITFLVLDEADRMLDMGFEPQIKKILLDIRPDRDHPENVTIRLIIELMFNQPVTKHTILTTATWPSSVRRIAERYTVDPFLIYVGSLDLAACRAVQQVVEIVEEENKYERIIEFIKAMKPEDKALIFVGRKNKADHLSSELIRKGIECQSMHGDRDQRERERALRELRKGEVRLLVATDVASRGLDVPDITHVINYDFPKNMEEYVHRVGRTGRAGKTGQSITLMTRQDWRHARELMKILSEAYQEVPPDLERMADRYDAMMERRRAEGGSGAFSGGGRPYRREPSGFTDPITGEWISSKEW